MSVQFLGVAPLLWGGATAWRAGGAHFPAGIIALVCVLPPPAQGLVNHFQAQCRQQAQVPGVSPGQGTVSRDTPKATLLLHSLVERAALQALSCLSQLLAFDSMVPQLFLGQMDCGDIPGEAATALG